MARELRGAMRAADGPGRAGSFVSVRRLAVSPLSRRGHAGTSPHRRSCPESQRGRTSDRGGGQAAKREPGVGVPIPQDEHGRRQRVSRELCRLGAPLTPASPALPPSYAHGDTGPRVPQSRASPVCASCPQPGRLQAPAPPAQLCTHHPAPPLGPFLSVCRRDPTARPDGPPWEITPQDPLSSQARWEPVPHSSKVDARARREPGPR